MEVQVSGYKNSRPVLTTYYIPDAALAEAVASPNAGKFNVTEELDTKKQYALLDDVGEFFGLIMFWDDQTTAILTTFLNVDWKPETRFQVHNIDELDSKLNY